MSYSFSVALCCGLLTVVLLQVAASLDVDKTVVRQLGKDEREIFAVTDDVYSKLLTTAQTESISMLTSSDGELVVQSIYDSEHTLKDCDVVENEEYVDNFTRGVQQIVDDVASTEDVEDDLILRMVDFKSQKRECRRFRKKVLRLKRSKANQGRRAKRSYLIFPGTNWCGRGNKAEHAVHLGDKSDLDSCCRQHDLCPFAIDGFSTRYNIFNYRMHTLSHCDCDKQFMSCLKSANSGAANVVGKVYFNVVNTQCFDLKLDKVCARRTWWGTCDKSETQWVADVTSIGSF